MSLNQEERTAVVTYRLEKADYNLDEEDVMPLVLPAEQLIAKVSTMARQALAK